MPLTAKEKAIELRQKRGALAEKAGSLLAETDGPLTGETREKWEKMHADIDAYKADIDILERQAQVEGELESVEDIASPETRDRVETRINGGVTPAYEARQNVIRAWLHGDPGRLSDEEMRTAQTMGFHTRNFQGAEATIEIELPGTKDHSVRRALIDEIRYNGGVIHTEMGLELRGLAGIEARQQGLQTGKGVELTADDRTLIGRIEDALLAYGDVRGEATVIRTNTGERMPQPGGNDTSSEGEIVAEHGAHTQGDLAFTQAEWTAYKLGSKIVKASWEILDDSAIDLENYIGSKLGERLSRGSNRYYTTGTGTAQPTGIVTAATSVTGTGAAGTFVPYDDAVELEHAVDPAYRSMGARWMFHDARLKEFKLAKDTQNRPLWLPGLAFAAPDTVLGYAYRINQHMDGTAPGNGKDFMLFGPLTKFLVREVRTVRMQVFREKYADNGQVGWLAWMRIDSNLNNAGTNPIKKLTLPST